MSLDSEICSIKTLEQLFDLLSMVTESCVYSSISITAIGIDALY